jgi:hypothetical protein
MQNVSTAAGLPASRNAPSEAAERNDDCPLEFQPESGALGPREALGEDELDHDRREDL